MEEAEKSHKESNFIRYMANPRAFTLKRWFAELLQGDYVHYDQIIERVATALTTETDMQEFGKLVGHIYEMAYRKAITDYASEAERLGLKVSIVASEQVKKNQD